ncbi:MAG TPA: T9SS type A sorting domain-containing protein [Chryseolinea sp.]|nr:T9SS type A sorting domain-containing protein [Chryseolinea sp.]
MKKILALSFTFIGAILLVINVGTTTGSHFQNESSYFENEEDDEHYDLELNEEEDHEDGPGEFLKFHRGIRTRDGEDAPAYKSGYKLNALTKAKAEARRKNSNGARIQSNGVLSWDERGPANVPGRTRGLLVDPDDAAKNTWYAGSVGGGVWKTSDGGLSWNHITPDLPNLATSVLAMAESNHNVIFIGTGEGFGNADAVDGVGIFKSDDRGVNWQHLTSTINFGDVNRIIIDPANENIVVAACNDAIYRSTNGGTSWTKRLNQPFVQDLKALPGNFNTQYATQNGVGVFRSLDAGVTWAAYGAGLSPGGRMELAISPVTPTRLFISAEGGLSGNGSDLYVSDDGGANWDLVDVNINNTVVDFLNEQGWYDNAIACHPFNDKIIYFGGVDLFQLTLGASSSTIDNYTIDEDETLSILALTNFSADFSQGRLTVGSDANSTSVEVRFGPGKSQKAHRFLVPEGSTSGVVAANFTFQDYVDVPFEVWDVANNRQLMVSFRDQGRDGQFNLILANTTTTIANDQSREYIYINNVDYDANSPNIGIAGNGGQEFKQMYFFWPTLATGGVWPPATSGSLRILHEGISKRNATATFITDARSTFGDAGKNENVHPDHHNIVMIPVTPTTFKILNANDGGVFVSNTSANPGLVDENWTSTDNGYNSAQFYGVDKKPGANEYFGGLQDNGTWKSPANASSTSDYSFKIGGDGFEVLWNNLNDKLLIGGSQGNNFLRSINGGLSFGSALSGLSGEMPFISKLANSKNFPDRIFTVGGDGVFVSQNFGQLWTLTSITQNWGLSTFMDIEVSRANANVIWAGSGMSGTRKIHYSKDGGKTFQQTNNYTAKVLGSITKLASHPTQQNTAYALFSFAGSPKIVRTLDAGQSWQDISGFGTGSTSTNGFPDVAVYCLYVRSDDPNIIWAGTEIGIVESLDNGVSWTLLEDFPNVSVWDMKGQDNQIVIATHGRGIWSATIDQTQMIDYSVALVNYGTSPQNNLVLRINADINYDSLDVYIGTSKAGSLKNIGIGQSDITISGVSEGSKTVSFVSYTNGISAPYQSTSYTVFKLNILETKTSYSTYFSTTTDLLIEGLSLKNFADAPSGERKNFHTNHPYSTSQRYSLLPRTPIKVSNSFPMLYYADIAITEFDIESDSVALEATKNGIDWISLAPGYDASSNAVWQAAYTSNQSGTREMLEQKEIDISETFNAGDTLLFRLTMNSGPSNSGWGWALDYLSIQEVPLANEQPQTKTSLTVYPNPTSGSISIYYKLQRPSNVQARVIDVFGRLITSQNFGTGEVGEYTQTLNLENYPSSAYLLVLDTNQGSEIVKVVLKK